MFTLIENKNSEQDLIISTDPKKEKEGIIVILLEIATNKMNVELVQHTWSVRVTLKYISFDGVPQSVTDIFRAK